MAKVYICWTIDCESSGSAVNDVELGRNALKGFSELLDAEGWKGTFFVIRNELEPLCEPLAGISESGHELAVHTHPDSCGYPSPYLGTYDRSTQKEIVEGTKEKFRKTLGIQPVSCRPGYASANDYTFPVLAECGIRQTSASMPGRMMSNLAANWAGAPLFAHYANPRNRFLEGGLDLVEIPISVDWETMIWGGIHPQDLRVEFTDAKNQGFVIRKIMQRQVKEDLPVKALVILTHNIFRYADKENFRRETMIGMIKIIKECARELSAEPEGATIQEVGAAYRKAVSSKPDLSREPDYSKYPVGLTGYTGFNLQRIACCDLHPAIRKQVGWRGLYKSGLALLPNGWLVIAPYSDLGDDRRRRLYFHHSADGGMTWRQIGPSTLEGNEPTLKCLRDGTLLLVIGGFPVSRSGDGAATWHTIEWGDNFSPVQGYRDFSTVRNIIEEEDDTLLLFVSARSDSDKLAARRSKAWVFRSRDGGLTWPDWQEITAWDRPEPMFCEASIVRLPDGRLLAAFRVEGNHVIGNTPAPRGLPRPKSDESGGHMLLMNSEDNGIHWTEPREFLNYSEVHGYLTVLQDGRILCTYANYHLPFGSVAVLSNDQGKTWDMQHPIQLSIAADMYAGWPTSLQLADGNIITSYARSAYLEHTVGMAQSNPDFTRNRHKDVVAEVVRWQLPGTADMEGRKA